jgi:hypothetical protein
MLKELILPKFSSEANERHLKFKNIILRHVVFLRCIPQPNRCWIQQKKMPALCYTAEEKLLRCGIQRKKFSQTSCDCSSYSISHIGGKPLLLYSTTEENLLHAIPQRRKTFSAVSHNRGKPPPWHPTIAEKLKLN